MAAERTPATPNTRRRMWRVRLGVVGCLVGAFLAPMAAVTPPAVAADVTGVLVRTVLLSELSPPSPDPSGIAWDAALDRFIISDSEVEEMPIFANANLFELNLAGQLTGTGDITPPAPGFTNEPTGLSLDPSSGHLFITDDGEDEVFRLSPGADTDFGTSDDVLVSSIETNAFGNTDPEDVAFDTSSGDLFTVDGAGREVYRISPGSNGIFDGVPPRGDDTTSHFDTAQFGAQGSEGLGYDPVRDTLLVVDPTGKKVFETTKAGVLLNTIGFSGTNPRHPEDVVMAPSLANPSQSNMYVVARGVDNNSDPNENDGKLIEVSVTLPPIGNQPPEVGAGPDQTITLPSSAALSGTVTDDGLPAGANVTSTWSLVSGPGLATFADPDSPSTTVSFTAAGSYTLRLTATDTELEASDDVVVTVQAEGAATLDISVAASSDDAEEKAATGAVARGNAVLNMGFNGSTTTVGLRFVGVTIPPGATISVATVQFEAKKTTQPVTLTIEGQAADNPGTFLGAAFNISSRPRTAADVAWSPPPWSVAGQRGPAQQTPDLSTVLQEIVDRPGWNSGNALVLIISGDGTTGNRKAVSFNGTGAEPQLHVEFTSA